MIPSNDEPRAALRWGVAAMVLVALAAWPAWSQETVAKQPEAQKGSLSSILEQAISIGFDEPQHIAEVAAALHRQYGVNIIIDWRVVEAPDEPKAGPDGESAGSRKVPGMVQPVHLSDLSLGAALAGMLRAMGLAYSVQDGFLWISTPERIKQESFDAPRPAGWARMSAAEPPEGSPVKAVPGMSISANEAAAAAAMRTISRAEVCFQVAGFVDADGDGVGDYGSLAQLANPDGEGSAPPFIDSALASGEKRGYRFLVKVVFGAAAIQPAYTCTAEPIEPGKTGNRSFFVDQSGVIRHAPDGEKATISSPPLS